MSILEAVQNVNAGGVVAFFVIILSVIEITPIKVSPLMWIGRRINKEANDDLKDMRKQLSDHIAQSSRNMILNFDEELSHNVRKSKEQWKTVVNAIYEYEKHCEKNNITNGFCEEASRHILNEYQIRLQNNNF